MQVCFLGPELGPLESLLVAPEGGDWYLEEANVSSSRTGHSDRCANIAAGRLTWIRVVHCRCKVADLCKGIIRAELCRLSTTSDAYRLTGRMTRLCELRRHRKPSLPMIRIQCHTRRLPSAEVATDAKGYTSCVQIRVPGPHRRAAEVFGCLPAGHPRRRRRLRRRRDVRHSQQGAVRARNETGRAWTIACAAFGCLSSCWQLLGTIRAHANMAFADFSVATDMSRDDPCCPMCQNAA